MQDGKAYVIDARGMRCPWPALRVAKAMRSCAAVLILADDPIAPSELQALAAQNGWACSAESDERGVAAFRIVRPQLPL